MLELLVVNCCFTSLTREFCFVNKCDKMSNHFFIIEFSASWIYDLIIHIILAARFVAYVGYEQEVARTQFISQSGSTVSMETNICSFGQLLLN